MTDKDKTLIDEAQELSCWDCGKIDALIEQADTDAARLVLEKIERRKYHMQEYKAGIL